MAFSLDGKQLAAVGLDVFHSVTVHLWQKSEVLYCSQVDKVFGDLHVIAAFID